MELEVAKKEYKDAFESGDSDRVLEAQQNLQTANMKVMQAQNFKLPPLQQEETEVQPETNQVSEVSDPKLIAWRKRNTWFGQDDEMTALAFGLHNKLQRSGVVPGSDAYWDALDKTMRKRFPEAFASEEPEEVKPQPAKPKASTVVAPAVRSTGSNKVRLKASQVQISKKLGITPEQYARELMKLES